MQSRILRFSRHGLWALPLVYFLSLHPISLKFGGLVFFLFGWAIPTIWQASLAFWLATKFGVSLTRSSKSAPAMILFLFFSLLPPAFYWAVEKTAPPMATEVQRLNPVKMGFHSAGQTLSLVAHADKAAQNFRASSFAIPTVGGDEGCMCLYFRAPRRIDETVLPRVRSLPGFKEPTSTKGSSFPEALVYLQGDPKDPSRLEVRIYKLTEMFTSSTDLSSAKPENILLIKNIPGLYRYEFNPNQERDAPFQRDFFQRTALLFAHGNWISRVAFERMSSALENQVGNFLITAIVP